MLISASTRYKHAHARSMLNELGLVSTECVWCMWHGNGHRCEALDMCANTGVNMRIDMGVDMNLKTVRGQLNGHVCGHVYSHR